MTSLIKIGNSQGIRLPKAIIKQADLENKDLEFEILDNGLLIKPVVNLTRANWVENINQVLSSSKNKNDDGLIEELLNDNDLEDYEW
ncbi:SpoVT / AbrB like domain protein [Aliarcobacter thereius]|uniref:AbrB/MazE/SpoVT family DNA-binding domain-containing protein n=1 Tax=Aliarcobacter thereius TaxID=544718 RepID=UPI000826FCBC|nr:AbrB/MazE/SpoVT family DNA-binding domain-containing protein [Aliarcobacter thereius]OCL87070.1 SpoVT / AbrB like domain protein [Aliarcobacter thereius]OCL91253.1 SpoVT / AbrB like domain protein [Aliarcobacter thereius]TLT06062.1 AbrB/MazE/SpoVT family DNA-binding domain-containing protein [Aliarcobacter thereius]